MEYTIHGADGTPWQAEVSAIWIVEGEYYCEADGEPYPLGEEDFQRLREAGVRNLDE